MEDRITEQGQMLRSQSFNVATAFEPWKTARPWATASAMPTRFNVATAFEPWKTSLSILDAGTGLALQCGHGF